MAGGENDCSRCAPRISADAQRHDPPPPRLQRRITATRPAVGASRQSATPPPDSPIAIVDRQPRPCALKVNPHQRALPSGKTESSQRPSASRWSRCFFAGANPATRVRRSSTLVSACRLRARLSSVRSTPWYSSRVSHACAGQIWAASACSLVARRRRRSALVLLALLMLLPRLTHRPLAPLGREASSRASAVV